MVCIYVHNGIYVPEEQPSYNRYSVYRRIDNYIYLSVINVHKALITSALDFFSLFFSSRFYSYISSATSFGI